MKQEGEPRLADGGPSEHTEEFGCSSKGNGRFVEGVGTPCNSQKCKWYRTSSCPSHKMKWLEGRYVAHTGPN